MLDTCVTEGEADDWWIVDYDLPVTGQRQRFYRRIRKYLKTRGVQPVKWSTYSVIITRDREFAEFAYDTGVSIGRAHLYRAERIK